MKLSGLAIFLLCSSTAAFVGPAINKRPSSRLFLEDDIAEMIDRELYRQGHKAEFEKEWMEKNRGAVLHSLGGGDEKTGMLLEEPEEDVRQARKDRLLANKNPQQYCADRCIATGNCEVYEDL